MRYAGTALTDYFNTPDFTGLGKTMMQGNSLQRNAGVKAEGMVGMAGINSAAKIKSAGFQADAIEAQGASQGQQSMMSGIGSMVSGIAGGFANMGGGGGTNISDISVLGSSNIPSVTDFSNITPHFGSFQPGASYFGS